MATATQELLDKLAQWYGDDSIASDYRLAKDFFRCSHQRVSQWRTGKTGMGDERVLEICEAIWPGDDDRKTQWLALVHADREQNEPVKSFWQRLAEQARAASLVLVVGIVGLVSAPPASAAAQNFSATDYVLCAIRRWLRRLVLIFVAPLVLLSAGCSTMQREVAWQALHVVDVAQTVNGPARDDCFIEADRLTRSLIGEKPSTGEALAWGAGIALVHAGVTYGLERLNAPGWLQIGWQVLTITNTSYSLVNNHREGIRPFGANDCPHG